MLERPLTALDNRDFVCFPFNQPVNTSGKWNAVRIDQHKTRSFFRLFKEKVVILGKASTTISGFRNIPDFAAVLISGVKPFTGSVVIHRQENNFFLCGGSKIWDDAVSDILDVVIPIDALNIDRHFLRAFDKILTANYTRMDVLFSVPQE